MAFNESRTYQNLLAAYEAELTITGKYEIYGDITRLEGYIEISHFYEEFARNNKEHARIWLRTINEGELPNTTDVLLESIQSETSIANNMYQEFSRIAREEGYEEISSLFSGIANIDFYHTSTLRSIYNDVVNDTFFCKPEETLWICIQCGNILFRDCAPTICPVCGFPQGYYRLYNETQY